MEGFHDKILVNDNLEVTYKKLENYIFGINEEDKAENSTGDDKESAVDTMEVSKQNRENDSNHEALSVNKPLTTTQIDTVERTMALEGHVAAE